MTQTTDKVFVNGLMYKDPRPGAPDFIKANLSIKREELITFLQEQTDEWINVDVKESKGWKNYCEMNTWKKPETQEAPKYAWDHKLEDLNF